MNLEARLRSITAEPHSHWKFLKHLSFLEADGHRKLLKYKLRTGRSCREFLQHVAEEARHAHTLKKFAEALDRSSSLSPGTATRHYLTKLEVKILRELREKNLDHHSDLCYLLTTFIIEERAKELYPIYDSLLQAGSFPFTVRAIIEDEDGHLAMMATELLNYHLPELCRYPSGR